MRQGLCSGSEWLMLVAFVITTSLPTFRNAACRPPHSPHTATWAAIPPPTLERFGHGSGMVRQIRGVTPNRIARIPCM
jgi:hypothetical protein